MNPPRFLYRYRPVNEFTLKEIAFNSVFFTALPNLNDVREGEFEFPDSDVSALRKQLGDAALRDGEIEYALMLHFAPDELIKELEMQGREIGKPFVDARGKWGVVCFTERLDNDRMWERYAAENRGCVIEYDTSRVDIPPGSLHKVQYQEKRGSTNLAEILNPSNEGKFADVLTIKDPSWEYEDEWRSLLDRSGETAVIKIPISRVITGPLMPNSDKNKIVNAIRQHGRARFAQMGFVEPDRKRVIHDLAGGQH